MANRYFHPVQGALQRGMVKLAGSFRPNGTGTIDNADNTGQGFTVVHTSTGVFTITLTDKYTELVSAQVSLQMNALTDAVLQFGAHDVSSAKTIIIRAGDYDGAGAIAAVDIASHANNRIHFELWLKNSSVAN